MSPVLADAAYRFENLPDIVHDHLRQRIFAGAAKAGEPLRQENIARALGISRVPVREALKRLEAEGLVAFRPRRGYLVVELDPIEITEIFEIRGLLEKQAGGLAAKQRSDDEVGEIEAILHEMDRMLDPTPENIDAFARINHAFHSRITACSRRPRLCRLLETLGDQVESYIRIDAVSGGRLEVAQREHWDIFKAFRAGDARATARFCAAHREHTLANLLNSLQRQRPTPPG